MTRAEHLQWCKDRAMEYINNGDIQQGVTSMLSDLTKHQETKKHAGIELGTRLMMIGQLNTTLDAERFINGFH